MNKLGYVVCGDVQESLLGFPQTQALLVCDVILDYDEVHGNNCEQAKKPHFMIEMEKS